MQTTYSVKSHQDGNTIATFYTLTDAREYARNYNKQIASELARSKEQEYKDWLEDEEIEIHVNY